MMQVLRLPRPRAEAHDKPLASPVCLSIGRAVSRPNHSSTTDLEAYNADFLIMLETWEAAISFMKDNQAIEVARLLGLNLGSEDFARGAGVLVRPPV